MGREGKEVEKNSDGAISADGTYSITRTYRVKWLSRSVPAGF